MVKVLGIRAACDRETPSCFSKKKQRALLKEVLLANSSEMINPAESRLPVLC